MQQPGLGSTQDGAAVLGKLPQPRHVDHAGCSKPDQLRHGENSNVVVGYADEI
jgi:hypothetical protein